jgi:integrase
VRLDNEFERFRNNLTATPIDSISRETIKKLTDAWKAHILEEDEEVRILGLSDRDYRKIGESLGIVEAGGKVAFAKGDTSLIEFEMEDFCESHGFNIVKGSDAYIQLAYGFLRASVDANNQLLLRHQGEIIETPEAPILSPTTAQPKNTMDSLDKLKEYWLLQPAKSSGGKKSRTSIAEANTIIKKFKSMVGDLKPSEITRSHVSDLKDKMLEDSSSPATINKGRGILAAIFSTAEKNGKLAINPCLGMEKLSVPRGDIERPYNLEELKIIFNSPIYTKSERPKRFQGESAYWIPLLALYSGARLNELGQIFTEDVGIEDDINYYMIKPDASTGRSVKDSKRRRVPIHPDLIKMGFLDYVSKIKSEGHLQLFSELKVTRTDGKLADKWGSWWCNYVREDLSITRIPQPMHGFRHTFIAHCRRCKVDSEHRRIIEGHVPNSIDMKSYDTGGFPLEPLHDELRKLTYKGLDLSHLYISSNK